MANINSTKLDCELREAGIPIDGCNSNGVISFKPEATQAHRDQATRILAAHNPYDYADERRKHYWPTGDQFDALYKAIDQLNKLGIVRFHPYTIEWMESCAKVKADYPKEGSL